MTKSTIYCDRCGKAMPDKPASVEEIEKAKMMWEDHREPSMKWDVEITIRMQDVPGEWSRADICHDCTHAITMRAMEEKTRRYQ